jgi:hypothetical protein
VFDDTGAPALAYLLQRITLSTTGLIAPLSASPRGRD